MPNIQDMFKPRIYDTASFGRLQKSLVDHAINAVRMKDASVAVNGAYLEQQLTYIIPEVLKQEYPERPALSIFDISNEGALEKLLVRRIKGYQGQHQRDVDNLGNPSKGAITVSYDAKGMRIDDFSAVSYYKEIDLMRALKYNDPLDASIIEAHDESYKTRADNIAFLGMQDESGNLLVEGLLNRSDVDTDLSVDSTDTFENLTDDGVAMYNNIKGLYATISGKAAGVATLKPDTLVTSPEVLTLLETTTYGTTTSTGFNEKSVAEMIKQNLGITELRATLHAVDLDDSGTTDRLVLFNRQKINMSLYIPQPLKFYEVFKDGPRYKIESDFRMAGLGINRKTSFGYLKGV